MSNRENILIKALQEIALAGMSLPAQEHQDGALHFHARQAWRFIQIAAVALEKVKECNKKVYVVKSAGFGEIVIERIFTNVAAAQRHVAECQDRYLNSGILYSIEEFEVEE